MNGRLAGPRVVKAGWARSDEAALARQYSIDQAVAGLLLIDKVVPVEEPSVAKRVIHELIDDINGQPADESLTFGLDGVQYEIDLTAKNAAKFRDALAPFMSGGTKLGRGGVTASRGRAGRDRQPARSDREVNQAIREWAKSKKIEVSDRGRIKQEIVDRYHAEAGR